MKARFYIDVEFNGRKTDAESIASAMDNVVKCGMSVLGDCWDEYGGAPKVGEFLVLDRKQVAEHADTLMQTAIEGLVEHYPQLKRKSIAAEVHKAIVVPDTGNSQADYENVRNQVEVFLNKRRK